MANKALCIIYKPLFFIKKRTFTFNNNFFTVNNYKNTLLILNKYSLYDKKTSIYT